MTAAEKKLRQQHRNCSYLAFGLRQHDVTYIMLRKILSLPKEPKLLLETQISKAVDISTNFFYYRQRCGWVIFCSGEPK